MQGLWAAERASPRMRVLPRRQRCPSGSVPLTRHRRPRRRRHLHRAVNRWGTPASVLTDGGIFTATPRRGGRTAPGVMLGELSINYISSRSYHPVNCATFTRVRGCSVSPASAGVDT